MKKLYFSLVGLLALNTGFAQVNSAQPLIKRNSQSVGTVKTHKVTPTEKAVVLWDSDFSDPLDWTIANNGTNIEEWSFSSDPTLSDLVTNLPTSLVPFASSTAANGFLFVNSDANNNADANGTRIITTATNALAINLFGKPNVRLNFQHNFRWWHDTRGVRVSGDNGLNWTDFEITNQTDYSTPNQNSDNPHMTSVDISAVAGGQTQVLIQFYYDDNDYWGWYWAVDDVSITVIDDYDLKLTKAYWGSTGFWGARLPYYQIPTTQIAPIDFSGIVLNYGVLSQSAITFSAIIPSLYTAASAQYNLVANQIDTMDCLTQFTPPTAVASHTVTFATTSGATDAFPADNTTPLTINITNYNYARDADVIDGGSFNSGDEFEAGNIFDIVNDQDLRGIDVVIGANAEAGAEVYVKLYSIDAATGDFVYMDESSPYILTDTDLGQKITFILLNTQALTAGESYLAVIASFGDGGATNDLVVATSGISDDNTSYFYDGTDQTWYFTTSTPMVRLNFDPSLSVSELENTLGMNVYPNPTNTNTTVSFSLTNESTVSVNVTDLAGKVIITNALGTVSGAQNINVNTENLTSGVYMVNVSVNGNVSTEKLIVRK
ncbi:MAG: hypothetical protein RI883_50 [Bacteroidota bacterium]|jgi:hypothetical protein